MKYINIEQALDVCRKHFGRCWENHVAGAKIAEEIKQEIEALPDVWISVKDRLPKKDGKYLCYNICLIGGIGIFSFAKNLKKKVGINDFMFRKSGWYAYDSECGFYEISNVTYWMPLPEPPKEEQ